MTEKIGHYYREKLSAELLLKCYTIAPPRIRQYLQAELEYVLSHIAPGDRVLDLGCGYGRIEPQVAQKAQTVIGIDISRSSLMLGREMFGDIPNCRLVQMDAARLAFFHEVFDRVFCIQNGISAFRMDPHQLVAESIRVTKPGGQLLFSTYSEKIWNDRLLWFQLQAEAGLIGEIDDRKTGGGTIVCKDGFRATTVTERQFLEITSNLPVTVAIREVDESSLFCEMRKIDIYL
ncbi:MAG: class I SAM-dependent methyltransferase [Candidatus Aminicenantales bacterium]